jgi:hypothetical protein
VRKNWKEKKERSNVIRPQFGKKQEAERMAMTQGEKSNIIAYVFKEVQSLPLCSPLPSHISFPYSCSPFPFLPTSNDTKAMVFFKSTKVQSEEMMPFVKAVGMLLLKGKAVAEILGVARKQRK